MSIISPLEVELVEKEIVAVDLIETEFGEVELSVIDIVPVRRNITDLDDVNIDGVTEGQVLVREGEYWVNKSISVIVESNAIYNEVPSFVLGKTFQTVKAYLASSLQVFLNGIKEKYITQISDTRFELPIYDPSHDIIEVSYIKK